MNSSREAPFRLTVERMSALLDQHELSAEELVRAHLDRAAHLDGGLRAFTVLLRAQALEEARVADQEISAGKRRGPLHGIPISVKECFEMTDQPSTLGVPGRITHRGVHEAALVRAFRDAGAIVIGRTNVSQLMLSFECNNPVYGRTVNPFSLDHAPGGSSGGEAAAIAAGFSPLGLGTDIGGSIRLPAHFSGVCGLKPTLDRLPNRGIQAGIPGQEIVRSQCGLLARTPGDLTLALRALAPEKLTALDGRVPPLPIPDPSSISLAGMKIGYFVDDGMLTPSVSVARALQSAADFLRDAGATLVPFTPPDVPNAIAIYLSALSSDGAVTARNTLGNGAVDDALGPLLLSAKLPPAARKAAVRVLHAAGEDRAAMVVNAMGEKSVATVWQLTSQLRGYRARVEELMEQNGLRAIIAPPFATAAVPHGFGKKFTLGASYTMLWNLVPLPAGVVPMTRVRPRETTGPRPNDRFEKAAREIDARSAGLPLGVQVVGRAWEESVVLAIMEAIYQRASQSEEYPKTPIDPAY